MEKRNSLNSVLRRAANRKINTAASPEKEGSLEDVFLRAAKREDQARSKDLVESGAATQVSLFFIPPAAVRASKVRRRTDEF